MNDEICSTCVFYQEASATHGYCKLNPPILVGTRPRNDGKVIGVFQNPTVLQNSFCSHWESAN